MKRHIAFLRAINVGGHTVKMDELRALFDGLGFADVATFIASGNVIFSAREADAGALERRIEARLRQALGYEVATFLRSPSELVAVAACWPFPEAEAGAALHVAFLKAPPGDDAQRKVLAFRTAEDDFRFDGRELYWLRRGRTSDSVFSGAALEKALGMPATLRNTTTVRKLAEKHGGLPKRASL